MSGKKNTRRAAMEAERFSWKCFRFLDDKRQWKQLAPVRRAFFIKAANSSNGDGTSVELSAKTLSKAGGEIATAFRRLDDMEQMGICLCELHFDRDGNKREKLSRHGTKIRRLRFEPLEEAQRIIDAGKEFSGHRRLTEDEQRAIQDKWLQETLEAKQAQKKEPLTPAEEAWLQSLRKSPKELSNSSEIGAEGVSNSPKGISKSPKGISPYVIDNRSILTEEPETEKELTEHSPSARSLSKPSKPKATDKECESADALVRTIQTAAMEVSHQAVFYEKNCRAIRKVILQNPDAFADESRVLSVVRQRVSDMAGEDSSFRLNHCGANLATDLLPVLTAKASITAKQNAEDASARLSAEQGIAEFEQRQREMDARRQEDAEATERLKDNPFGEVEDVARA